MLRTRLAIVWFDYPGSFCWRLPCNAPNEPGEFLESGRQPGLSSRFELLEVRILIDDRFDSERTIAQQIFEPAAERGDHFIPRANFLNQCPQVALLPEMALVA